MTDLPSGSGQTPSGWPSAEGFATKLIEASPLAFLVLDSEAVVTFASTRAGALIGRAPEDVVGENVLQFVHPSDLERCAEILDFGRDYTQSIMGPVHVRYLGDDGREGYVDLWSNNCLENPEVEGIICVLNEETANSRLADAVTAIAETRPLAETFDVVAAAMGGHPVSGDGVILGPVDRRIEPLTPSTLEDELRGVTPDRGPWHDVLDTGTAADLDDLSSLAPAIRRSAEAAGYRAVWVRPITVCDHTDVRAALVVWSKQSGRPSPNQEDHLLEATAIASLAFGRLMLIDQLTHAAHHDHLTGLGNRSQLYAAIDNVSCDEPVSVLYLDLDNFKQVNDEMGHDAGDQVLVTVAKRITETLRRHDQVARVGGDEFVVVLHQLPAPAVAERVADRIALSVGHPIDVGHAHVRVGVSIGIAHGRAGDGFAQLVRTADRAMYSAKRSCDQRWSVSPSTFRH